MTKAELSLAAVLFVYVGPLSPITLALQLSPALGSGVRLCFAMVGLLLLYAAGTRAWTFPAVCFTVLGLMPYAHLASAWVTGEPLTGTVVYLYKFSPFLACGWLCSVVRSVRPRVVYRVLLALGAFIALRALFTYAFPEGQVQRMDVRGSDAFSVYEVVDGRARVFFPGLAVVYTALLVAIRESVQSPRSRAWTIPVVGLTAMALMLTMTRGLVVLGGALLATYILANCWRGDLTKTQKAVFVVGAVAILGGVVAVASWTGISDGLLVRLDSLVFGRGGGASGLSTMDWRYQQADIAFEMWTTDLHQLFGIGTNVGVPFPFRDGPNEIHLSYHSVLWSFGWLGLTLLVIPLGYGLFCGLRRALNGTGLLELSVVLALCTCTGAYTIVFTNADWNIMIVLCIAFLTSGGPARRVANVARRCVSPDPSLCGNVTVVR